MANNKGGARPGAGRPPGSKAITSEKLQQQIIKHTGKEYDEIVALTIKMVWDQFSADPTTEHTKAWIAIQKVYAPFLFEAPKQVVEVTNPDELPEEEIEARIKALMEKGQSDV